MNISSISDTEVRDEYVKRFTIPMGVPIRTAQSAADHFRAFFVNAKKKEVFVVCFLNGQNQILATEILFEGSINTSAVYPREVVSRIIELGASAVMLAHNHPSGSITPSSSDRAVTKKLETALRSIDVDLLDHIIVGGREHFSFSDHRML